MANNKTMVIYTLENGKYHAYITGMNLYVSDYNTLEECEVSVAEEFKRTLEPCTIEQTANQLKRYFEDGDEDILSPLDIEKIHLSGEVIDYEIGSYIHTIVGVGNDVGVSLSNVMTNFMKELEYKYNKEKGLECTNYKD